MQNLRSSACGCREHALSAVVEFGGSFRAGAGLCAPGLLDRGSPRREGFSLLAAAPNAGITLSDTADLYEQGESERILGDALKSVDACIVTKARRRFSLAESVLPPLRSAAGGFSVHPSYARAAAVAARVKPSPRNHPRECFRPALLGSLPRSEREPADISLLHSPSAANLKDGEALDRLSAFKREEGLVEMRRRYVRRSSDVVQYRFRRARRSNFEFKRCEC
jgi:aryl-alcohol dehydrogenase-like predicted oxidoreductase